MKVLIGFDVPVSNITIYDGSPGSTGPDLKKHKISD